VLLLKLTLVALNKLSNLLAWAMILSVLILSSNNYQLGELHRISRSNNPLENQQIVKKLDQHVSSAKNEVQILQMKKSLIFIYSRIVNTLIPVSSVNK